MKEKNTQSKAVTFSVTSPDALLSFLRANIKGQSRNSVKSILGRGNVSVNGTVRTKFDFPLKPGDNVTIAPPTAADVHNRQPLEIFYEDADLIVAFKPEGLLSIATDNQRENTAYRLLTDYVKQQHKDNRIFIVHRLDRDTSGLLLFAKNQHIKEALQSRWNELVLSRNYIAVVEGRVTQQQATLRSYLKETTTHVVYSAPKEKGGLLAVTNYQVVSQNDRYTLLSLQLETGRKNQIRVQLSDLGHPVAGDKKYGAQTDPLRRLCLHAQTLTFVNPLDGHEHSFTAPTPKSFSTITASRY